MSVFARWRYEEHTGLRRRCPELPQPAAPPTSSLQALARFRAALGDDLTDDDVFYYVYGVLHASDFRTTFESSLKKEKPRVPLVEKPSDSSTRSLPPAASSATSMSTTRRSSRTRSPRSGLTEQTRMPTRTCCSSAPAR